MAPKECIICASECYSLAVSPTTCTTVHVATERACSECWEVHLSLQVEELDPRNVECMFCNSNISRMELRRLARKITLTRYDKKLLNITRRKCQDRCAASADQFQSHDRSVHGRVFACQFCHFKTCIDCDRPEHDNETCDEYRTRVIFDPKHVKAEAATRTLYSSCPGCDSIFEMANKKCGATQCEACGYRFCSRCLIPWVGESSAYLGGRKAHFESCSYRTRDTDSIHGLKRRFEPETELERKQRLEEREAVKRQKLMAKKPAVSEASD